MKQGRYGNYERIMNLHLFPFGQIDVAVFMIRLLFNLSALPARSIRTRPAEHRPTYWAQLETKAFPAV